MEDDCSIVLRLCICGNNAAAYGGRSAATLFISDLSTDLSNLLSDLTV